MSFLIPFMLGAITLPIFNFFTKMRVSEYDKYGEKEQRLYVICRGSRCLSNRNDSFWWHGREYIEQYCLFNSKEDAEQALAKYLKAHPSLFCRGKRAFAAWLKSECE